MENINLFLSLSSDITETIAISKKINKYAGLQGDEEIQYLYYQSLQCKILSQQLNKGFYEVVNANKPIEEVYWDIIVSITAFMNKKNIIVIQ